LDRHKQWRSQEFSVGGWRGSGSGKRNLQAPEAIGYKPQEAGDLGAKPPSAGGKSEAPSAGRLLQFFNKNNAVLCIFRLKWLFEELKAFETQSKSIN